MAKKLQAEPAAEETKPVVRDEMAEITANIEKIEADNGGNVKVRRPQPGSPAANQLKHFAGQDRVRTRIGKSSDDSKDAFEAPQVNDLMITVKKGVNVYLPDDIVKILEDAQSIPDSARSDASLKELPKELEK